MSEIEVFYEGDLSTRCVHGENGSEITTDAPKDNRGKGRVFSPTDLLAASLGSCLLTLMGMAAERLRVELSGVKASVTKEMSLDLPRRIVALRVVFHSPRSFSPEIEKKLEEAGRSCPVHYSLRSEIRQEFIFHWGPS